MSFTAPETTTTAPEVPIRADSRIRGLDGLRALAVTVVMLYHLSPGAVVGGFLGVDVFFVISGFLITTLLLRELASAGRVRFGAFWVRRARRLLPALALVVLVCSSAAVLLGGDVLVGLGAQILGAMTFSSNWVFLAQGADYFDSTVPELFRNFWSLAVEEQFYLLWPLLLVLVIVRLPFVVRVLAIAALAAGSAIAMTLLYDPGAATRVYYGTDTHAFGLAIGALLAVLLQRREEAGPSSARAVVEGLDAAGWRPGGRRVLGLLGALAVLALLALAAVLPEDQPLVYRGGLVLAALLSAVAILAVTVPGSRLARVLDWRPISWVGERSYGLYLWHWPVFVLVVAAFPALPRDGLSGWTMGGVALGITVAAAAFSYRFVEQPVRRHGFRAVLRGIVDVPPRTGRAAVSMAAMVAAVALATGTFAAAVSDPGTGEAQEFIEAGEDAVANAPTATPTPTGTSTGAPVEPTPEAPALGGDQITAIGDSVLLAAAPKLQEEFPGIAIDAQVSRSMYSAPAIVEAQLNAGTLRRLVVLALGTNGGVTQETLEKVRLLIGSDRQLIVVNSQAPRGWIPDGNAQLSAFAQRYREVELANWYAAIQPHLGDLASDQVHFGPTGAAIFVGAVREAVQRLAELPPSRDDSADLSLPAPF